MLERAEELKQWVRETPLNNRLDDARRRIGKMCSEGRPPRMTIPVQYDDDDFYISTTLSDAQAMIADLQRQVEAWHKRLQEADEAYYAVGELNDALQQRVAQLEGEASRLAGVQCLVHQGQEVSREQCYECLQTDHARVLGLLNGILKRNQGGFEKDDSDIRLAVNILKEAASLPAQPAQGGANG